MMGNSNSIDELFREKLEDLELTPPMYVLKGIQERLDTERVSRRKSLVRSLAAAAAVVLAFLAGWQLTTPTLEQRTAEVIQQHNPSNRDGSSLRTYTPSSVKTEEIQPTAPIRSSRQNSGSNSFASFGANSSFIQPVKTDRTDDQMPLSETEKDFISRFQNNFEKVKQLAEWFSSTFGSGSNLTESTVLASQVDHFDRPKSSSAGFTFNSSPQIASESKESKWIIKAEVAPLFNTNSANQKDQGIASNITPKSQTKTTYSTGLLAGYKLNKNLTLKSGILYHSLKQSTSNAILTADNSFPMAQEGLAATQTGNAKFSFTHINIPSSPSKSNNLMQEMQYVEVPVQASYRLVNKKMVVGVTGGISTNFLVGNNATLTDNEYVFTGGETANLRNLLYSASAGVELGYNLTNRIAITIEPRFKQFLNSVSKSKGVGYRPSQLGIVTGLTYSFN